MNNDAVLLDVETEQVETRAASNLVAVFFAILESELTKHLCIFSYGAFE